MSESIRTLKVLLSRDTSLETAEHLKNVIKSIKGVAEVEFGDVVGIDDYLKREAAVRDLVSMLIEVLYTCTSPSNQYNKLKAFINGLYCERTGRNLPE